VHRQYELVSVEPPIGVGVGEVPHVRELLIRQP